MLRENKFKIIITSLVILLPAFGAFWGYNTLAIVSAIFLPIHLIVTVFATKDPNNRNQNKKAMGLIYWVLPFISLWFAVLYISVTDEKGLSPETLTLILLSAMLFFIGNYMPKIQQNRTLGIKTKATLSSQYVWNKTHRMAGKLWVGAGFLMAISAFLPYKAIPFVMVPLMFIIILIPAIYASVLYKKQKKNGEIAAEGAQRLTYPKWVKPFSAIMIIAVLSIVAVLMFTGDISVEMDDNAITMDSIYGSEITVNYSDITSVEYTSERESGMRIFGFDSARLQLGDYRNDTFGQYTNYCYRKNKETVIIKTENQVYAVNLEDAEATKALYEAILAKLS